MLWAGASWACRRDKVEEQLSPPPNSFPSSSLPVRLCRPHPLPSPRINMSIKAPHRSSLTRLDRSCAVGFGVVGAVLECNSFEQEQYGYQDFAQNPESTKGANAPVSPSAAPPGRTFRAFPSPQSIHNNPCANYVTLLCRCYITVSLGLRNERHYTTCSYIIFSEFWTSHVMRISLGISPVFHSSH